MKKNVNQTMIAEILGKDKTTISRTFSTLKKKRFHQKIQVDKKNKSYSTNTIGWRDIR